MAMSTVRRIRVSLFHRKDMTVSTCTLQEALKRVSQYTPEITDEETRQLIKTPYSLHMQAVLLASRQIVPPGSLNHDHWQLS